MNVHCGICGLLHKNSYRPWLFSQKTRTKSLELIIEVKGRNPLDKKQFLTPYSAYVYALMDGQRNKLTVFLLMSCCVEMPFSAVNNPCV